MRWSFLAADLMAWRTIRLTCRQVARRRLTLTVEGQEHVPAAGPAVIAARHVHHLYDGCALLDALPRPAHVLVGLDWVRGQPVRRAMEWACATARWPVVLRTDALMNDNASGAYRAAEARRYLRRAWTAAARLLADGRLLVVFPEGYPAIEPGERATRCLTSVLPFRPGLISLVEQYERRAGTAVPLVPAGLSYAPENAWRVSLRFGPPLYRQAFPDRAAAVRAVEEQVCWLSLAPDASGAPAGQKVAVS